jgi:hypothetical protein
MENPESPLQANLIKILPVVQGFNINKCVFGGPENKLLVGLGASLLLRYDVTLGYMGYFESSANSTITDIVNVD